MRGKAATPAGITVPLVVLRADCELEPGGYRVTAIGGVADLVEALERGWRPPVPADEQGHQGRDQQGPD